MISERRRGLRVSGSTSGTTGAPIWLHQDLQAINREHAFVWRQLAWAGMKGGERRVWIRGEMIVPADQKGGPYWRAEPRRPHADDVARSTCRTRRRAAISKRCRATTRC